jgi:hypothetical protein
MATQTKAEKQQDLEHALGILESVREDLTAPSGLLLISAEWGKSATDYFRVSTPSLDKYSGRTYLSHLTWAIAKVVGYRLRDKNGYWSLAIYGGGYSKSDEIARNLAIYYGVERIAYEII